jgi:asparaginyl-tRNA synthetase
MKDLTFVDISDGSCSDKLQVVVPKNLKQPNMTFGSSVEINGILKTNSVNNQRELLANSLKIIGTCDPTSGFPFAARKSYPDEYVRQFLHFRPRHSTFACVMRLRDAAVRGLHDVLEKRGFVFVHTPILTSNDCEGAGEVFLVTPSSEKLKQTMNKEGSNLDEAYFNNKAYLTVSGQLHLEAVAR